ncbi:MAG: DUF3087 domain-containing protein [Gammaproteobacteria bacterium]|nr:DUF3087 domain-containing protein [Gammaproteobacteria bacterium]
MFKIEQIDPVFYRKQTRKATLIIMAIFIVIGFSTAYLFVSYFGEYSNNKLVLNLIGAFIGLIITGYLVKTLFADKPWMRESMYAWQLKRSLMHITNVERHVKEAAQANDPHALKVLRFYHLGLEHMHKLEGNSSALIDMIAEKKEIEEKMQALGLPLEQTEFDAEWVERYKDLE